MGFLDRAGRIAGDAAAEAGKVAESIPRVPGIGPGTDLSGKIIEGLGDLAVGAGRLAGEAAVAGAGLFADDDSDSPTEIPESKELFVDQDFLTSNILELSSKNQGFRPTGYKNFISLQADPSMFISALVAKRDLEEVLRICPEQQAYLVPKIRLYKIMCSPGGGNEKAIELPFKSNHTEKSIESLFKNRKSLGAGVGIKSVQIKWLGNSEASWERNLRVDITIIAETVGDIFHAEQSDGVTVSVDDLLVKAPGEGHTPGQGRIHLVAGWANPRNFPSDLFSPALKEAIRQSRIVLDLQTARHNINLNQDGSVEIKIQYNAWIRDAMGIRNADLFNQASTALVEEREDIKDRSALTEFVEKEPRRATLAALRAQQKAFADVTPEDFAAQLKKGGAKQEEIDKALKDLSQNSQELSKKIASLDAQTDEPNKGERADIQKDNEELKNKEKKS